MYSYIISPIGAVCNYVGGMLFGYQKVSNVNQAQTDDIISETGEFINIVSYNDDISTDSEVKIISEINCINDYDEECVLKSKFNEFIDFIHNNKIYDKLNKKDRIFSTYKSVINRNNIKKYVNIIKENNIHLSEYDKKMDHKYYLNQVIAKYVFSCIITDINKNIINDIIKIDEFNKKLINEEIFDKADIIYILNLVNFDKKYVIYHSKVYKNENNSWNIIIN